MAYTTYDTLAVVVDSWPYKDASRRLELYTKQLGRILVRAQAVRKLTSKLGPAVQCYSESQVELVYGRSGWRLVGASAGRNFFMQATAGRPAMQRSLQLFTRLVPAQQADPQLYEVLRSSLQALSRSDEDDTVTIEKLFVLRLVSHLGYAPDPSGQRLLPFLETSSYDSRIVSAFADAGDVAVEQINQALETVQM